MTVILPKSKSHYEMLFYINSTYKNGWSRSTILNQIAMKSYERSLIEPDTSSVVKSDDSLMKLGISKYKLIEELPEYLERKLNAIKPQFETLIMVYLNL